MVNGSSNPWGEKDVIPEQEASALYIEIARQYALSRQVNLQTLESFTSFQPQPEPALQKLPLSSVLDYWHQIAEACAAPAFGLQAGGQCHLSVYGIFSHLLLSCPTLERAIQLGVDHMHILNEAFETQLTIGKDTSDYTLRYPVEHPAAHHHVEFHLASVVRLARQIARQKERSRVSPERVEFCHPPGTSLREYETVFGCEVRFQQPQHRMVFASSLLTIPGQQPNAGLHGHLLKLVEAIGRQRRSGKPYTSRVYAALAGHDPVHTWPTLESLAASLGLSPSSLKRRLKQEQTCYQTICDQLRYKQAKQMLTTQQLPIGEIAHQLGFSSPASFSRSFKRWSGVAPCEYGKEIDRNS